ncbi:Hypothetical predicted protein [Mytilus galloprovincialis]|uniref:B box-type domain-containing protein n=1 Tax=Mytilus galloprovincialis TaxID=29158 RepID=A0A8B6CM35_MYTGA|nr:Hypothetical predicted protein [Mytilus galloprovincialis]
MDVNDKKDLCSPCEFKGKTETATAWCTECEEPFCITCFENHNAHRSSRDHHVISVEGNKMLESLQIPLNEYCEVHDQEKDLCCSLHWEIICQLCTQTTHGECVPGARLSEVTKNTKTSTFVTMLASNVADVVDELRDILRDKENNKKNRSQCPIDHQLKLSKALVIKIPRESFPRSTILRCIILPNKQMIFVDSHARNKPLTVLNEDGTHDGNINMTSRPFDIAVFDNNKIAISFPWRTKKRIGIIDMINNKSDPDILLKNKCYGIAYDKKRLFVVVKTEGIVIMDISGNKSACLPIVGIGIFYVHVNNRLYCSDECNDTVQCYNMEGCSIWICKDSNLGSPRSKTKMHRHFYTKKIKILIQYHYYYSHIFFQFIL